MQRTRNFDDTQKLPASAPDLDAVSAGSPHVACFVAHELCRNTLPGKAEHSPVGEEGRSVDFGQVKSKHRRRAREAH